MEWKIGEIKQVNGEWYQCVESKQGVCTDCAFNPINGIGYNYCGSCTYEQVIFKKLEKVGEPMKIHGRLVIKVKADAYKCMRCCFYSKGKCELTIQECEHYDCGEESNFLEIKQSKEDMEEKELDPRMAKVIDEATQKMGEEIGSQIEANINKQRMKPFNLELAKQGKPVCTRDGRKARIICFDKKEGAPIVALVETEKNERISEEITLYFINGRLISENLESKDDLMMLPEKKEGWINVYALNTCYSSKADAEAHIDGDYEHEYVRTVKIEWKE